MFDQKGPPTVPEGASSITFSQVNSDVGRKKKVKNSLRCSKEK